MTDEKVRGWYTPSLVKAKSAIAGIAYAWLGSLIFFMLAHLITSYWWAIVATWIAGVLLALFSRAEKLIDRIDFGDL